MTPGLMPSAGCTLNSNQKNAKFFSKKKKQKKQKKTEENVPKNAKKHYESQLEKK